MANKPGYGTATTESDTAILASEKGVSSFSITLAADKGDLKKGTLLGIITASGKYAPYNNANSDGTETAVCILGDDVNTTGSDATVAAYFTGIFVKDNLTGYDANALTDLNGRVAGPYLII